MLAFAAIPGEFNITDYASKILRRGINIGGKTGVKTFVCMEKHTGCKWSPKDRNAVEDRYWGKGENLGGSVGPYASIVQNTITAQGLRGFGGSATVDRSRKTVDRRNAVVHGKFFKHPNDIVQEVNMAVEAFQKAQTDVSSMEVGQLGRIPSTWKAPTEGWHKTNCDVAIDKEKGQIGIVAVVRDWTRRLVAARSLTIPGFM